MTEKNYLKIGFALWLILYSLLHFPASKVDIQHMHAFRQAMTQNNIRNFAEEDFNIFNPRRDNRGSTDGIYRMEFPVMQWVFAGVHRVFDTNDIRLTRLLTFILGVLSVIGIYRLLNTIFRKSILAGIGAWFFSFSPTFYYFTVCPMPDNFALCCGIWALVTFLLWTKSKDILTLLLSGFLFGIATAAKLPFILYCAFPFAWFLAEFIRNKKSVIRSINFAFLLFFWQIFAVAWYIIVIPTWGENPVLKGWFSADGNLIRGLDYFQHHLISTLPENLINFGALVPFLFGLYLFFSKKIYKSLVALPFIVWFGIHAVYFIYEMPVIGKSHDYYFLPVLPLIAIVIAYGSKKLMYDKRKISKILLYLSIIAVPIAAYFRINDRWLPDLKDDLQVHKSVIRNTLPHDALIVTGNDISAALNHYYIDRKGWSFSENNLTGKQLKNFIEEGAEYLISNSRQIENQQAVKERLKKEIYTAGEYKIFLLKKL